MLAYRLHAYASTPPLHLDTLPVPTPTPTQALIHTSHAALNPIDWKIALGHVAEHMPLPFPYTLGVDFVGTITSLGANCPSRLKKGDRVMTLSRALGAFAESLTIESDILAKVPDGLSDADAATLPIPGLSAWQSLHAAGPLEPGMKVLIHGASGVVGALAVQLAKAKGLHVVGTASGKNREFVVGLGADGFVDYTREKFEDVVGMGSVDLVLDYVLVGGAANTTERSWGVLKEGGAIVSLADPTILGKIPEGKRGFFPEIVPDVEGLEKLGRMLRDGEIKAKVAKVYRRGELLEGMEANKAGGTTGRLLVDFRRA
ncbi:hypothetical protein M409DRAFT_26912 [Zasmidium cellare ATCC 36951]|uniref:Enoyl reductase (ER) domain-containing protein n=1 Tax=Zasmidium cellare ATCC 36951 TaxID=1080233 RepID=A0A6A6C6D8_ZASCE|nr:uncharacterized protein M409DRAFT_26912 [Zasmidium cellare ATCC 36951]KAF2162674.1 hypothetical protein M409DRAFT_26912 [Zasmidium cellare ATCC 36951]